MALLFTSWWTELYFTVFLCLLIYYLHFKLFSSKHWQKLNIFHVEPLFLLGNIWNASFTENFAFLLSKMHIKHKAKKLVGFWNFRVPMLLVTDIEIIKKILASDFSSFRDRGFEFNFDHDPLAGNLFNIGGAKWRNLRVRLTPTFTSGRMKMMFPTLVQCGEVMQEVIKDLAGKEEGFEVKDILARYSTDVISSCAFGIETNSLKNPDSEFRKFGKKIFDPTFLVLLRGLIFNFSPYLFSLLKFKFTPADVSEFFLNAVRETMEYREKHKVRRNDFMELLIQLKNKGKLEDVDGVLPSAPDGDAAAPPQDIKFTFNEAAAQAFVFFAAGFETSSTTLTFALYELSLNTQIQYKLQQEIDDVLEKNGGKMSYEGVMNSEYLDWVVQDSRQMLLGVGKLLSKIPFRDPTRILGIGIETLRKHPPVSTLFRQCNKDYKVPEMDVTIPNKTNVLISTFAIHRDPEYFPEPEKFDPERFSPEEKEKRDSFTFLPFGEGPRNCIGNRFGLMQTKVGLFSILSKFSVQPTKRTLTPLKYDKKSFVLASEGGVILRFVSRH